MHYLPYIQNTQKVLCAVWILNKYNKHTKIDTHATFTICNCVGDVEEVFRVNVYINETAKRGCVCVHLCICVKGAMVVYVCDVIIYEADQSLTLLLIKTTVLNDILVLSASLSLSPHV